MKVSSIFLQNYAKKANSNPNLDFRGLFKLGKDIRRCCGLYYDNVYTPFSNEWTKKLPENTSISVVKKSASTDSESYIVKSLVWDKRKLVCKKCAEDEILMDTDGISKDGQVCRWEDIYAIESNKEKLLECLNKHLNKIKKRLKNLK